MINFEQTGHIRDAQALQRIEEVMAKVINNAHSNRLYDMVPIKVDPSPNPKPTSQEALDEIARAKANLARAGLRTGPLTAEERIELGLVSNDTDVIT